MPGKKQIIQLSKSDKSSLTKILAKKETPTREQTRARILDSLVRQEHPKQIAELLGVSIMTVYNIQRRFLEAGFRRALGEKARSGKPPTIKPDEKAKITALACSDAPEGRARWTLRLLADKAVEMGLVRAVSHTEVGRILKKRNFDRTGKK